MKRMIIWCTFICLWLGPGVVRAGDEDVIWGVLFGAGAGLILGESVDGWHSSATVPIGAIAGGLMGSELERTARRRHNYRDGYGLHRYDRYRPYYGWCGYRREGSPRDYVKVAASRAKNEKPAAAATNYHPGVDVVKVEIRLVTGAAMDVRLLRMLDGSFVGPQGEVYTNLPTAAALARYTGQ